MLAINLKQKIKRLFENGLFSRSLFAKYYTICVSVILTSFIILGVILAFFTVRYSNSEKQSTYLNNANIIGQMLSGYYLTPNVEKSVVSVSAKTLDADIYVTDTNGNIVVLSQTTHVHFLKDTIPQSVMDTINNGGSINQVGNLNGLFSYQCNTVGVPIQLENGNIVGAVFISSKATDLLRFTYDIFNIFIYCILVVLIFTSIVIYFITARMVRPLKQMSNAARSFASGDFSVRVPVRDKDEIGQLAVAFNNMAKSLVSLEDMRRNFVANVSHELKTPMTTIAGFIDGILDGTIPPDKQSYYLKIVSDEVKRLSRMVRSLLDIARIEAGQVKINYASFEIMQIITKIIIGFERQIDEKALDIRGIDPDLKVQVTADPDITYQIIYNLIENAVKFSNKGGFIEINVVQKDKKVFISVKNSGMGIPANELPYVFERFYKTDKSRGLDRKGVGLGLYIVKSVLNRMGQDIVVRSVEGEFCEFVFTLDKS